MKLNHQKILLGIILFQFSFHIANSQEILFQTSNFAGGYNVSCHGASDGYIHPVVYSDQSPFTYLWSTGSYSKNLDNITAGTYTLTVTASDGSQFSNKITLIEPAGLGAFVSISDYNGANVSSKGATDGDIKIEPTGGTPSYIFLWNDGSTESDDGNLGAGSYSVTITDVNGCTYSLSRTLTEPQDLQITGFTYSNYNGYNVSCSEGRNGTAQVSVVGGVPPYTYRWNNGDFSSMAQNLSAGDYRVQVTDNNGKDVIANITLTQPPRLGVHPVVSNYSNGYNVSCFQCANGSITMTPIGGIAPYTFLWNNGQVNSTISGLSRGDFLVTVTDNNGCSISYPATITEPARENWSMVGNSNSNPSTQFLGTSDSNDFVFKTNSAERLRLKANGDIQFPNLAGHNNILMTDINGKISPIQLPTPPCAGPTVFPWQVNPNNYTDVFSCWRRFGIGTDSPRERLEVSGMTLLTDAYLHTSYIKIGHDGGPNGGGNAQIFNIGSGDLLINYNNNKNINLCTGTSTGNVVTGGNTFLAISTGQVGIGTSSTSHKLEVNGDINATDYKLQGNTIVGGLWSNNSGSDIFRTNGKVGVGIQPTYKLDVLGPVNATDFLKGGFSILQGIWQVSGNNIFYNTGNVGIGNANPLVPLVVGNGVNTFSSGKAGDGSALNYGTSYIGFNAIRESNTSWRFQVDPTHNGGNVIWGDIFGDLYFSNIPTNASGVNQVLTDADIMSNSKFKILNNGKVIIGDVGTSNISGNYSLFVTNGILTEKMKISLLNDWADNVFLSNYKLMSIKELESYIKINSHLPEVPSNKDLKSEGIDIEQQLTTQMKKIEELTLYVIELQKEIDQLKSNK